MTHAEAVQYVGGVWRGEIREDARLPTALARLGMSLASYARLAREARRVSKRRCRLEIPTPTGGQGRQAFY